MPNINKYRLGLEYATGYASQTRRYNNRIINKEASHKDNINMEVKGAVKKVGRNSCFPKSYPLKGDYSLP